LNGVKGKNSPYSLTASRSKSFCENRCKADD